MNPSTRGMSCNDGINPNLSLKRDAAKTKWGTEPDILISSISSFPENRALSPIFPSIFPSNSAGRLFNR